MTADAVPGSPESAPHSHPGALGPAVAERVGAGLARLQAAGLRRTPARGDVLAVLITAGAHLTVPQVHARLGDADRSFDYDYSTVLHAGPHGITLQGRCPRCTAMNTPTTVT